MSIPGCTPHGSRGLTAYRYNDNGQQIARINPSAIVDFDPSTSTFADLIGWGQVGSKVRTDQGLIEWTDYYSTTGGGGVANFVSGRRVQRGSAGTQASQGLAYIDSFTYATLTAGTVTAYLPATVTLYRNGDLYLPTDTSTATTATAMPCSGTI